MRIQVDVTEDYRRRDYWRIKVQADSTTVLETVTDRSRVDSVVTTGIDIALTYAQADDKVPEPPPETGKPRQAAPLGSVPSGD